MREIKFRIWDEQKMDYNPTAWCEDINECLRYSDCDVEVMQYTGLKDKNGKEIYEGDIMVEMKNGRPHKIQGGKNLYVWVVWNDRGCWELDSNNESSEYSLNYRNWEIIGNIYQNKDLLI